jgi:MFS family permease
MTNDNTLQEEHNPENNENAEGGGKGGEGEEKREEGVTINVPVEGNTKIEQLETEKSTADLTKGPNGGGPPPEDVKKLLTGTSLALVFIGMCLAVFLAALDQTIVATALPTIAADLNGFSDYSWVATAYLLTTTAFQPLYGRFSDIFGRKPVMLFAIVIFEIGSLLCGVSQTMTMLIISRAIAGVGGGGLISMVMIIMSDVINIRDRGKYQGIISAMFGLASVVGPLLGGKLKKRERGIPLLSLSLSHPHSLHFCFFVVGLFWFFVLFYCFIVCF